ETRHPRHFLWPQTTDCATTSMPDVRSTPSALLVPTHWWVLMLFGVERSGAAAHVRRRSWDQGTGTHPVPRRVATCLRSWSANAGQSAGSTARSDTSPPSTT